MNPNSPQYGDAAPSWKRVIDAFSFRRPDRVPRYEIFLPEFIKAWRGHYCKPDKTDIYDCYPRIDIGTVLSDHNGPFSSMRGVEKTDGEVWYERDGWGRLLRRKEGAYFEHVIETPFEDKRSLDLIEFESPLVAERYDPLRKAAKQLRTRFALVSGVLGLFMGAYRMRGEQQFLIDTAQDESFVRDLVGRLGEFTTEVGKQVVEATGTKETAIWVYDEFSSRLGPLISPDYFERLFLPTYKKMIAAWKLDGVERVILHCDGNSLPLFDVLEEAGFSGVQSMAPTAGMWLPDVKAKYGNRFVLIGGMCNIRTLAEGTKRDIEREATEVYEAARSGGVVIGTHSIGDDIPIENYNTYYEILDRLDRT